MPYCASPATTDSVVPVPDVDAPTVAVTVALLEPTVAVSVADPSATPSTSPASVTFTFVVSLLRHRTGTQPANGMVLTLNASADTLPPDPTPTEIPEAGVAVTEATAGITKVLPPIRVGADNPIAKRAICCASMMFTVLSAVTSPVEPNCSGFATESPTAARAICCASRMLMTLSPFTSPHFPNGATHTSKPRLARGVASLLPIRFDASDTSSASCEPASE